jgi:5-methylcytosine-specific restriction endonuclease McrA
MLLKSFDPNQVFEELTDDLREYVFARDEGLCVKCGNQGSEPHHIIYRSHIKGHCANLIATLCYRCHGKIHTVKDDVKKLLLQRVQENEKILRERLV